MIQPQFITEKENASSSYGRFIIGPLPHGFGHTMGNALRRVLLSSIQGAAATYIKVNDATHPFSVIKGIKESVLDIILNVKLLRFKLSGDGPFEVMFEGKGTKKITGADFHKGDVEVVNKDQHIGEITVDKTKCEMTIVVEKGYGYSPSEDKAKKEFGMLAIDSIFTPVKRVNFTVSGARVGRKTNFDKLILDVWTDGSVSPEDALTASRNTLSEYFLYLLSGQDSAQHLKDQEGASLSGPKSIDKKVYQTIIDELDLPTRVINALLREKIETVEDLVKRGKGNLVGLKGLGDKSFDLIEKELEKLGIAF